MKETLLDKIKKMDKTQIIRAVGTTIGGVIGGLAVAYLISQAEEAASLEPGPEYFDIDTEPTI